MSNLDATLAGLAAEVNALEADRAAGNQGKMIEMGHKLIAIRQILREVNGEKVDGRTGGGSRGCDGRTPRGWTEWVAENLTFSRSYAMICVRSAVDPEFAGRRREYIRKSGFAPSGALRIARKAWPDWTHEQREQFSKGVLELLRSA